MFTLHSLACKIIPKKVLHMNCSGCFNEMQLILYSMFRCVFFGCALHYKLQSMALYQLCCTVLSSATIQFNSIQCNSPSAQFITLCHSLIDCDSLATVLIATHHNSSSSLSSQYSIKFSQIWSSPQQQHRRQTTKQQTTKNRIAYINRYCRLLNHCDKSFSLSIAIIIIVVLTKLNMLLPVLLSLDCGFTTWSSMVI